MGGFFGVVSKSDCAKDVFYGTDYHSHLGTKRAGIVFIVPDNGYRRSIHSIENSYFRNKFENELSDFSGNSGLGVVRGTQLRDSTIDLRESGAKEVHMRIACPPLLFACEFLNFSESRSVFELAGRKAIQQRG
ncbi:MAG: hypothetical protein A2X05_09350 [Bacteroidetes bacterium GWE2_41_25]|nr:MAG: hypothetical protein A2X03_05055 [Bacteroidetes bacterium GWA2_40_15]OFX82731.1 MAG: hypothetical protein A2X06_07660 [Bacteroidetes bacterium GWC2_40_22]OFY05476.1 MAG: hypothetical protein A2X05_09350 [Bacteroidetes bacterium GWE2_41_25]OFY58840.1 MAG: hypothetical protein A2X04_15215 [Bacteroidetes bacterium GWF2_41_9]HBH84015.1 hypothetical protein [Bacteroidales bacterium]